MFATLFVLSLAAAPADPPKLSEAAQKELKKLEGKWSLTTELSADGEKQPTQPNGDPITVEFKDRKVRVDSIAKFEFEILALDPSTKPKCIDWKCVADAGPLTKGDVLEAIYKLDGDTLTVALYLGSGKSRPAGFDRPKEERMVVVALKRVKE